MYLARLWQLQNYEAEFYQTLANESASWQTHVTYKTDSQLQTLHLLQVFNTGKNKIESSWHVWQGILMESGLWNCPTNTKT